MTGVEAQFMRSLFCPLGNFAKLIACLMLLALTAAKAQDAAQRDSSDKTVPAPKSMGDTKKPEKKISLSDVTPASTEKAARSAVKETLHSASEKEDDKPASAATDSVLEFQPASQNEKGETKSDAGPRTKHPGKNIHGEAYGGLDSTASETHRGGGAVNATSKSGKTSVYVQADQSRSTSSPH